MRGLSPDTVFKIGREMCAINIQYYVNPKYVLQCIWYTYTIYGNVIHRIYFSCTELVCTLCIYNNKIYFP